MSFKAFSNSIAIFTVLMTLLASSDHAVAQTCDTATGCTCLGGPGTANNFTGIDFRKAFVYPIQILDDQSEDEYYFIFDPCDGGFACGDDPNEDKSTAVCMFDTNITDLVPVSCGRASDVSWKFTSDSNQFSVTYANGDPAGEQQFVRETTIEVTIDNSVRHSSISYAGLFPDLTRQVIVYNFEMTLTPRAANGQTDRSGGTSVAGIIGLVLLLLLVVGVSIYFVGGIIFNYVVKGAKGAELIPNLSFWKSLPVLVKDGCCFVISPITKAGGSTRYERQTLLTK